MKFIQKTIKYVQFLIFVSNMKIWNKFCFRTFRFTFLEIRLQILCSHHRKTDRRKRNVRSNTYPYYFAKEKSYISRWCFWASVTGKETRGLEIRPLTNNRAARFRWNLSSSYFDTAVDGIYRARSPPPPPPLSSDLGFFFSKEEKSRLGCTATYLDGKRVVSAEHLDVLRVKSKEPLKVARYAQ